MAIIEIELNFFSPRWGHDDTYKLELSSESIVITLNAKSAKCTWRDGLDPEWSGESLLSIFRNDSIYPPEIFQNLIEHAWKSWRNGELNDTELNEELQALETWLNVVTSSKPDTDFWQKYF